MGLYGTYPDLILTEDWTEVRKVGIPNVSGCRKPHLTTQDGMCLVPCVGLQYEGIFGIQNAPDCRKLIYKPLI